MHLHLSCLVHRQGQQLNHKQKQAVNFNAFGQEHNTFSQLSYEHSNAFAYLHLNCKRVINITSALIGYESGPYMSLFPSGDDSKSFLHCIGIKENLSKLLSNFVIVKG